MARILVVDDSEDLQDAYDLVLASEGHEVSRASNGKSGLEKCKNERPDVVLLDMMMPELDGLGFLERWNELPDRPPVIANSGFDTYRDAAMERGAAVFLRKPVEPPQLLAAIGSAVDHRAVPAGVLADNARNVDEQRARAAQASSELMAMIAPEDVASLRHNLDALADWLPGYYGFGSSFIQLLRGDQLFVEACGHAPPDWYVGKRYPRKAAYCDFVIDAGSTLLLCDPVHHPCRTFADHEEVRGGWRFYAGVPLTTSDGCVLGTLCLLDQERRELHEEDMNLLESLGLKVAHSVEDLATGLPPEEFVVDDSALFTTDMLPVLLEAAVHRAARSGGSVGLGLVDLTSDDAVTDAAAAVYCSALGPGLAVVRRGRHQLALVEDGESDSLPRNLAAAVSACQQEGAVRTVGVGWTPPLGPGELGRDATLQIQADLLRRAAQSRAEALRRPTDRPHA